MLLPLALAACASPPPEGRAPDIVLVLIDTLRADHTSFHGYHRDTTPNLTAFAADNVVFERTRSQASCTFASVNSLLTSRYPTVFYGQPDNRLGIPEEIASLPTILRDHGYRTFAVSASPIVRASPSTHNDHGGFGGGFEVFHEECEWADADCVHGAARDLPLPWEAPFFLYLHYIDPHDSYQPPQDHERHWAGDPEVSDYALRGNPNPIADMLYRNGPTVDVGAATMAHLRDLYDEEIAYLDSRFPELVAWLAGVTDLDSTLLVIASDHGEEFMEHGLVKHCYGLYDTLLHTPLVMKLPGVEGPIRVPEPVQNLDVLPTILDYAGIDPGATLLRGRSLRALVEGEPAWPPADDFAAQGVYRSVATPTRKLLYDLRSEDVELFDLAADPGELVDLSEREPEIRRRMLARIGELMTLIDDPALRMKEFDLLEDAQRRLRALGYLR